MPYRLDARCAAGDAFDRLVELGALDVELLGDGQFAALLPDSVAPDLVARALGVPDVSVSSAVGRDEDSVWVLSPRPIQVGHHTLRMIDAPVFGTGLHPTTALCLEALEDLIAVQRPDRVLDVGTGSGVLALAALMLGVSHATGLDIDEEAVRAAAKNARLNGVESRLQTMRGGPDAVTGTWPLVVANVLAAPLIEMAPTLVRRVGHQGALVLSGIPASVEPDVHNAYRRLGMHKTSMTSRAGWVALVMRASW